MNDKIRKTIKAISQRAMERNQIEAEEKLFNSHIRKLDRLFPNRNVNLGWYQGHNRIETKVYGNEKLSAKVLVTSKETGKLKHWVVNY